MKNILEDGTIEYLDKEGKRHRNGDKPAVVYPNGTRFWYHHGKPHRGNDKPAYTSTSGCATWWVNGLRHRNGGPAIVDTYTHIYYQNGVLHRTDGPAVCGETHDTYYQFGELHRLSGQAQWDDGYWIYGKIYSKFKFLIIKWMIGS